MARYSLSVMVTIPTTTLVSGGGWNNWACEVQVPPGVAARIFEITTSTTLQINSPTPRYLHMTTPGIPNPLRPVTRSVSDEEAGVFGQSVGISHSQPVTDAILGYGMERWPVSVEQPVYGWSQLPVLHPVYGGAFGSRSLRSGNAQFDLWVFPRGIAVTETRSLSIWHNNYNMNPTNTGHIYNFSIEE